MHYWQRRLDSGCMFLKLTLPVKAPYDHRSPLNTNVKIGVTKLSFADFVFNTNLPAYKPERSPLMCTKQKPVLLITNLISTIHPPAGTIVDFRIGTTLIAGACLSAPKHFKSCSAKHTSFFLQINSFHLRSVCKPSTQH